MRPDVDSQESRLFFFLPQKIITKNECSCALLCCGVFSDYVIACGVQPTNLCPLYEYLHGHARQGERESGISRKMTVWRVHLIYWWRSCCRSLLFAGKKVGGSSCWITCVYATAVGVITPPLSSAPLAAPGPPPPVYNAAQQPTWPVRVHLLLQHALISLGFSCFPCKKHPICTTNWNSVAQSSN